FSASLFALFWIYSTGDLRGLLNRCTLRTPVLILLFVLSAAAASAQNNYEIQVYGADTIAPQSTMVELHSNFTAEGAKPLPDSVFAADRLYPTNHTEHETVEITTG